MEGKAIMGLDKSFVKYVCEEGKFLDRKVRKEKPRRSPRKLLVRYPILGASFKIDRALRAILDLYVR